MNKATIRKHWAHILEARVKSKTTLLHGRRFTMTYYGLGIVEDISYDGLTDYRSLYFRFVDPAKARPTGCNWCNGKWNHFGPEITAKDTKELNEQHLERITQKLRNLNWRQPNDAELKRAPIGARCLLA